MMSMRRYIIYLGVAACFVYGLVHFRENIIAGAKANYGPHASKFAPAKDVPASIALKPSENAFNWSSVPTRYPVVSLTPLPTEAPKQLPKVQYDFPPETNGQTATRKDRQAAVKRTFDRCWKAYKQNAWLKDELAPLSGGFRNGFGGWAANLVDNLDNLWIMGMKDDFEEAVKAAIDIDLSKSAVETVNVFETTIRHLGGLLSAYDLSGDKRLLSKAIEVGEMLLVAFDTPNRMPITRWSPDGALKGPQEADPVVLVAEIGSLTMEFTRLSQVTHDMRWYDAVERILELFDKQQDLTHLPGMWPVVVNAKDMILTDDTFFTLSAMSDSLYEYLPKMHALLGGVNTVYKSMYDKATATAIRYNLWRPMVPDNADILISGNVRSTNPAMAKLDPQGQHLACFTGGMFALGGRLFNQPSHVEIGKKLTDGCIWTYRALPLGIMPEVFTMVACESRLECTWEEEAWKSEVLAREAVEYGGNPEKLIKQLRLPPGFTSMQDRRYILRPEAIESVFILYRVTGESRFLDAAWEMFNSIVNATQTPIANAALSDISYSREELAAGNTGGTTQMDSMESFWMAETLKYFYLIFSETSVLSLDKWVFNTEAHPFKRQLPP